MATCEAPGHPDCSVTCPNGCGAIYNEPDGPCSTFCADSSAKIELDSNAKYSLQLNNVSSAVIEKLFSGTIPPNLANKLNDATRVSITLSNVSPQDLADKIEKTILSD